LSSRRDRALFRILPNAVAPVSEITEAAKKCGIVTGAGVVTVRKVDVKAPKTHP